MKPILTYSDIGKTKDTLNEVIRHNKAMMREFDRLQIAVHEIARIVDAKNSDASTLEEIRHVLLTFGMTSEMDYTK